eukprot:CAMPEP_0181294676 /NCGR_PEP_ID=MMETSP1101-20121128/3734_1 /TAXON_ID=46948 /ORGANISM="Rhodomonas abbreviata, Strain Caron Lab Isolate" /LENGTH=65 /DNA_ID=CAMNT_0023399363 /DNA_START=39 /DNA_END=233 /DNA_ORIENTATION=+
MFSNTLKQVPTMLWGDHKKATPQNAWVRSSPPYCADVVWEVEAQQHVQPFDPAMAALCRPCPVAW